MIRTAISPMAVTSKLGNWNRRWSTSIGNQDLVEHARAPEERLVDDVTVSPLSPVCCARPPGDG